MTHEIPMYRLSSTHAWYDGMTFDSLASAKRKADQCPQTCDVLAFDTATTWRAVYASRNRANFQAGTYQKRSD